MLEQKQAGWRSRDHAREWLSSLKRYAFSRIGKVPVSEVTSADVLEILTPIWHRKADTARRVRLRLRAVLEWAVAMEHRIDNPCDRIGPVLGVQKHVAQHVRALRHREVAAAIEAVRGSAALPAAKLAFELLVLAAARWGEVRWAEWAEIDRSGRVWTIPARRMKTNRQHRVPLCGRALEILEEPRHSERRQVRWCSPMGAGRLSTPINCGGWCASLGLRPCRTGSDPVSGTGRPRRRIIPGR